MNYGAEPADQVVRYSLEGMEYSLKITGNVAKHVAIFIAATFPVIFKEYSIPSRLYRTT